MQEPLPRLSKGKEVQFVSASAAIGALVGVAVGVSLNQVPICVGLGAGFGAAICKMVADRLSRG